MALSGDYFDSWFKRIDKQLQRADARTNKQLDRTNSDFRNLYSQSIVESQQVAAVADLISTGFAETQDKLHELDSWEAKLNDIEEAVDNRLDGTEKTLNARINKMESELEDARALSHNALCARGWQWVKPVRRRDGQGVRRLPPNFPRTVQSFWNLKDASKSKICVSPLNRRQQLMLKRRDSDGPPSILRSAKFSAMGPAKRNSGSCQPSSDDRPG